jgi:DNA-binding transcriptional LysR family regulator
MPDLNSLVLFARVVEAKSFSEAARRLALPVSTVSRRIAELEDQLGVRLLDRSTRHLRLTEIGAELLEHAQRSAEASRAVEDIVANRNAEIAGLLRLSAPPSISDTLLAPILGAFQSAYPAVRVEVLVTDRWVDHIAEGVDLVFRLGALRDSSLVARRLLTYRHRLVASPGYLREHPMPRTPQDLAQHRLLAFSHWRPENQWHFVSSTGERRETIAFEPFLAMNDYAGLAPALVAGLGIGDLPPVVQPNLLREGKLVEVMPDWRFRTFDLSLVHLSSRHTPRPVRAFIDRALEMAPTLFPDLPR